MPNYEVKITPYGGLGQIGSNMALIEDGETRFFIDAGILFPYEDAFDINYLIPDYKNVKDVDAIVITHGHEDHIGGIKIFSKQFPEAKIFTSPFTKELIKHKLQNLTTEIETPDYKSTLAIGKFNLHFINVNHSIPETFGILVTHQKIDFSLFFVSDFKVDLNPSYEKPFDFKKLKDLTDKYKKRIIMLDSTNVLSKNKKTATESEVVPELDDLLAKAKKKRIFITTFSSNIHRLKTIFDLAKKHNRKITALGRSVYSHLDSAKKAGLLGEDYEFRDADSVDGDNLIVLLSGCQGDFKGALRRYAYGLDPKFKPDPNDLVIFSSKTIPGNEKKVSIILNKLSEAQVDIVTSDDRLVHVSGHGGIEDIKKVIEEYRPTDIVPIHGESFFLNRHYEFIKRTFPQSDSHLMYNFMSLSINPNLDIKVTDPYKKTGERPEPLLIHGNDIEIERTSISERRKLATQGLISLAINRKTKHFDFIFLGLPNIHLEYKEEFFKIVEEEVKTIKDQNPEKGIEALRVLTRRYYGEKLGYRPIVIISYI